VDLQLARNDASSSRQSCASGWGSINLGATATILIDSPQYQVAP